MLHRRSVSGLWFPMRGVRSPSMAGLHCRAGIGLASPKAASGITGPEFKPAYFPLPYPS